MTTTHPSANDSGLNLDHLEADSELFEKAAKFGRKTMFDFRRPGTMKTHKVECVVLESADVARFVAALANQPAPTVPAITDEQIEELFKSKGGRWQDGDDEGFWLMEDADLHPFVRTVLAHQPAQEQAEPVADILAKLASDPKWQFAAYSLSAAFAALRAELRCAELAAQQEPVAVPQQAAAPGNTPEFGGIKNSASGTPEAPADVVLDAQRWRAFLGSARIRIIGSAGIKSDTAPDGTPHNNYAHFGMEIWTKYGSSLPPERLEEMRVNNESAQELLTKYADIARAAQLDGGQEGSESNG